MKTRYYLTALLIFIMGSSAMYAQRSEKKNERFRETVELIEGKQYEFVVQNIQPTGGKVIRPTTIYKMTVSGDHFDAYLPYFGRAYQASMTGESGVVFSGEAKDLKITKNEKRRTITLAFNIEGENDRYSVTFSVGYDGYASLSVNSIRRQSISYSGVVNAVEE